MQPRRIDKLEVFRTEYERSVKSLQNRDEILQEKFFGFSSLKPVPRGIQNLSL